MNGGDQQQNNGGGNCNQNVNSEFPYNGIFGPDGFLSSISNGQGSPVAVGPVVPDMPITTILDTDNFQNPGKQKKNNAIHIESINDSGMDGELEEKMESMKLVNIRKRVETGTGSSCGLPPNEMAISIDHIAEKIFNWLGIPDLLSCRSVCHRWKTAATTQLRKHMELHFYGYKFSSCYGHGGKSLTELNELLLLQEQINSFHCSKFVFTKLSKTEGIKQQHPSDQVLESFLSNFGENIDELTLLFVQNPPDAAIPQEKVAMEQLRRIAAFVPNIRSLSLSITSQIEWEDDDDEDVRDDHSPLRTTDPEFTALQSLKENCSLNLNSKLKILNLRGTGSAKILEMMIQLAPNLCEIHLDEANYNYLVEPLNRLHFLKRLWISPVNSNIGGVKMEELENLVHVASRDGNFNPRELTLHLSNLFRDREFRHEEFESRAVNLTNKILDCSSHSLEALKVEGVSALSGLHLPQVMPKLKRIELCNSFNCLNVQNINIYDCLPTGFSLSSVFPNLQSVRINFLAEDFSKLMMNFLMCDLNLGPLPTVKHVYVPGFDDDGYTILTERTKVIKKYFPNAQVICFRSA